MNNKIAVNTYVLTITLNANELNASVKRQNGGWMGNKTRPL